MVDFSIILCSRKRESYLRECLSHIKKNSSTNIEVLVGCDLDDSRYLEICGDINKEFPFCQMVFQERGDSIQDYLNNLANRSSGKYIFVLNDDAFIISKNWDIYTKSIMDESPCLYGLTFDNSCDKIGSFYTGFPIIKRAAVQKLGFVLEPTFKFHGADVVTCKIYKDAEKIIDLTMFVKINHVLHGQTQIVDKTREEMTNKTISNGFNINDLLNFNTSRYVKLLNE